MQVTSATTAPAYQPPRDVAAMAAETAQLTKVAVAKDTSTSEGAKDAVRIAAQQQVDLTNPEAVAGLQAAMGLR